ncbi:MAG TPA: bacteriophage holin [Pseudonocardiaceae bacterium]|nr:bacteriophage holin [Pseudonocardiaceae bacterium]
MPYLLIVALIVAVGIVLFVFTAIRLRTSLRRFGMVRGWLEDQLTDRAGMLRARSAALAIAVEDLRRPAIQQDVSRIISTQDR